MSYLIVEKQYLLRHLALGLVFVSVFFNLACKTTRIMQTNQPEKKITEKLLKENPIHKSAEDDFIIPPYRKWGFLGIELAMVQSRLRIESIQENTPARIAGIQTGDILLGLDKMQVNALNVEDVLAYIRKSGVGARLTVIVERNGEQMEFNILTITHPQDLQLYTMGRDAQKKGKRRLAAHYFQRLKDEYSQSPLIMKLRNTK